LLLFLSVLFFKECRSNCNICDDDNSCDECTEGYEWNVGSVEGDCANTDECNNFIKTYFLCLIVCTVENCKICMSD